MPVKEIINLENEKSIYDLDYSESSNYEYSYNTIASMNDESKEKEFKITIKDPTITIEYENIKHNEECCNELIEQLKNEDKLTRSCSTLSTISSSSYSEFTGSLSNNSNVQKIQNSIIIEDNFDDINFKFVDASIFNLQVIPPIWIENLKTNKISSSNILVENEIDKKSEWRKIIYNSLKNRNVWSLEDSNKFQIAIEEVFFTLKQ